MLNTEKNTPTMERKVLIAARAELGKGKLSAFFEHGQWWVEHRPSGAQWSACDCNNLFGFCFEQVTQGDE